MGFLGKLGTVLSVTTHHKNKAADYGSYIIANVTI